MRGMEIHPIRRIAYTNRTLDDLLRLKYPVKIQGFKAWKNLREKNRLIAKIRDMELDVYQMAGNNLDVSEKDGIRYESRGKPGNPSIQPTYMARTIIDHENFFSGFSGIPFRCNVSSYFKARVWVAAKGTRTPLHRDLAHNLLFLVTGDKHIRLAAPSAKRHVYPHSLFSRTPNFADLNLHRPDFRSHPRAKDLSIYETRLASGELLYIPPLWWHDVSNTGRSTSMNFWFAPFGVYSLAAGLANFLNSTMQIWTRRSNADKK